MTVVDRRGITLAMLIYKILRENEWLALCAEGTTRGAPVDLADGFIHFSAAGQVAETAAKHFAGQDGLVLVAADPERFGDDLKWETSRGGALFPHLYRDLRLSEVSWMRPLPRDGGVHVFPEDVAGHVDPTRDQFDRFKALGRDRPLDMLNLVRLRDRAVYPADHPLAEAGLSGAGAYARYGAETAPVLKRIGASILWRGGFETVLIGPAAERWDHVFIARYPSAHAFLEMVTDPEYRQAVKHRQAAVETSRLIRCAPAETGETFG